MSVIVTRKKHTFSPDSSRVIARFLNVNDERTADIIRSVLALSENKVEREGYVPNVVYSCGSITHNDSLIIPYAMSDYSSTYATVNLKELLDVLKKSGK